MSAGRHPSVVEFQLSNWVWVKIKPPGNETQDLVRVSIYQGKPFWGYPIVDNHSQFYDEGGLEEVSPHGGKETKL